MKHASRMLATGPLLVFAVLAGVSGVSGRALAAEATTTAVSNTKSSLHTVEIPVEGMACFVCAGTIKSKVKSLAGVLRVEVSLEKRTARVTYFGDEHVPEQIVATIDRLGYKAGNPRETP